MTVPPDTLASTGAASRRPPPGLSRRYSRFVSLAKRVLPAVAAALLLLVAVWPRIEDAIEHVRISLPRLDLREAKDLRMVAARYSGIDKQSRPYVVTAEVARQNPNADDIISLEGPKGDLTTTNGSWFEVTAYTGLYQPQTQHLDLFGNVQLFQDKGNEFHTDSAHINMGSGDADGQDPVDGQGPFGHITSEGFRLVNNGETIIFTGKSHLDLRQHNKEQK